MVSPVRQVANDGPKKYNYTQSHSASVQQSFLYLYAESGNSVKAVKMPEGDAQSLVPYHRQCSVGEETYVRQYRSYGS